MHKSLRGRDKMRRRRITEIFPFLLPIRKFQRKIFFYLGMFFDGNKYAKTKSQERLEYEIFQTESVIINKSSGFDIQYQINKEYNLKLASKTINGLIIKPNEVFSFWQLVRHGDKDQPYKDGLNLVNGQIVGSYGGGLCQLSNDLYWAFLHTPLTILERHGHVAQNFPSINSDDIKGVDATISEGWKDLKVKNETNKTFQIIIHFLDGSIHISILSDFQANTEYEILNKNLEYYKRDDDIYEEVSLVRRERNKDSKETKEVELYRNKTKISYKLEDHKKVLERKVV